MATFLRNNTKTQQETTTEEVFPEFTTDVLDMDEDSTVETFIDEIVEQEAPKEEIPVELPKKEVKKKKEKTFADLLRERNALNEKIVQQIKDECILSASRYNATKAVVELEITNSNFALIELFVKEQIALLGLEVAIEVGKTKVTLTLTW